MGIFKGRRIVVVGGDAPNPNPVDIDYLIENFDNLYFPAYAKNSQGEAITQGQEVREIVDLAGDKPMYYNGIEVPHLNGKLPVYSNQLGGIIVFENQPGTTYQAETVPMVYPFEQWFSFVPTSFIIGEAWGNKFGSHYFGDANSFNGIILLRVRNDGEADARTPDGVGIPENRPALIRRVFLGVNANNPNFVDEYLEINGVYIGKILQTYKSDPNANGIGAETNNELFAYLCQGFKRSRFLDAKAQELTAYLMDKLGINQVMDYPYASDVNLDPINGNIVGRYVYHPGKDGSPQDVDATLATIKWAWLKAGVTDAYFLPFYDGMLSFPIADFLSRSYGVDGDGNPEYYTLAGKGLRFIITPTSQSGRAFAVAQSGVKNT